MDGSGAVVLSGQAISPQRTSLSPATVSVVLPALNEERNLPHVLAEIPATVDEVILVDGRSVDDTITVARAARPKLQVVEQTRRGKGNALACGFAAAVGDIIVMLDADGSNDPAEIPRFVQALCEGADYAKGSRFVDGGGSDDITRLRSYGSRWINRIANGLCGTQYTDICYGYNAFRRECLLAMQLEIDSPAEASDEMRWGDGFEIEALINLRVAAAGYAVVEVPSFERDRMHGRSNLNAPRDGLRFLRTIAAERRRARQSADLIPLDA